MAQPECSLRLYLHVLRAMTYQLPVIENEDNVMQKKSVSGTWQLHQWKYNIREDSVVSRQRGHTECFILG